jgi:hypothetical protein
MKISNNLGVLFILFLIFAISGIGSKRNALANEGHRSGITSLTIPLDRGWVNESYTGGLSFRTVTTDKTGNLVLQSTFEPADLTQGEVFFELENLDNIRGITDFVGATIAVDFEVPMQLVSGQIKSGAQLYLETENADGKIARQYSSWKNLNEPGSNSLSFQPVMPGYLSGYYTDPGFDIERGVTVGFKLSLGSGSSLQYKGPIHITNFTIKWAGPETIQKEKSRMSHEQIYLSDELNRLDISNTSQQKTKLPPHLPDLNYPVETLQNALYNKVHHPVAGISNIKSLGRLYKNNIEIFEVSVNFINYDDDIRSRSARVENHLSLPIDVRNRKIMAWFAVDIPLRGVLSRPNRVSIVLTDIYGNVMRGPLTNASVRAFQWQLVELLPTLDIPISSGSVQSGFDITKVQKIGIRFERGKFSHLIHKTSYPNHEPYSLQGTLYLSEIMFIETVIPNTETVRRALPKCENPKIKPVPKDEFIIGINYPWIHYGWDVGKNPYGGRQTGGFSTHRMRLEKDFKMLRDHGINFVRFFLLSDLRTGIVFNQTNNLPFSLDGYVKKDVRTVAKIAHEYNIRLIPTLIDFLVADGAKERGLGNNMNWEEGEMPQIIIDERYRDAFVKNVIKKIIREIKAINQTYNGIIYAIDIGNELGNAREIITPENFKYTKQFIDSVIQVVREEAPELKVTLGIRNYLELVYFWKNTDIDVWQFHYYDDFSQEGEIKLDYPSSCLNLKGPVIIGEVEPSDIAKKIDVIYKNGYQGAFFWSMHERDGFKVDLDKIKTWRITNL